MARIHTDALDWEDDPFDPERNQDPDDYRDRHFDDFD